MNNETRYSGKSWDQLIDEARNPGVTGPMYEAIRRLCVSADRQTAAVKIQSWVSAVLTVAIIFLMLVQIFGCVKGGR